MGAIAADFFRHVRDAQNQRPAQTSAVIRSLRYDRRVAASGVRTNREGYRTETGDTWRPRNGSHSSQTGKLTSAAIDARDYLRARKDRETSAHLPEGTLVAFTGGKDFGDVTAIWHSLDSIKLKYDDMVLLHGGGPGAEKIAASWAEKNGVHQVVCKPNWDRDGKAAPFRRNDVLLNFLPKGLRNLSTTLRHRRFLFTDSFLLLWKLRVG